MRITTQMSARTILRDLNGNLDNLSNLQVQMSTGMQINKPSDDPYGTSRAMELRGELNGFQQYTSNVNDGTAWLNASDTALSGMGDVIQRARELTIEGGTDSASPQSRSAAADEIDQLIGTLKQEANVQYAGSFIFSGTAIDRPPYGDANDAFGGNTNAMQREIGPGTNLDVNVDISSVLGNGQTPAPGDDKLIDTLRDISADLRSGNGDALRGTDLNRLDSNQDALIAVRAEVGARTNRMTVAYNRLQSLTLNATRLLSDTEDADTPQTLTDYTTESAAYQMALKAGANVIQPSLLDFLS
ncbi:MAG TPA: flagellar hook-associated protein FlgL [Conexibacter sp.]